MASSGSSSGGRPAAYRSASARPTRSPMASSAAWRGWAGGRVGCLTWERHAATGQAPGVPGSRLRASRQAQAAPHREAAAPATTSPPPCPCRQHSLPQHSSAHAPAGWALPGFGLDSDAPAPVPSSRCTTPPPGGCWASLPTAAPLAAAAADGALAGAPADGGTTLRRGAGGRRRRVGGSGRLPAGRSRRASSDILIALPGAGPPGVLEGAHL